MMHQTYWLPTVLEQTLCVMHGVNVMRAYVLNLTQCYQLLSNYFLLSYGDMGALK